MKKLRVSVMLREWLKKYYVYEKKLVAFGLYNKTIIFSLWVFPPFLSENYLTSSLRRNLICSSCNFETG